jgi:hypothetical protein
MRAIRILFAAFIIEAQPLAASRSSADAARELRAGETLHLRPGARTAAAHHFAAAGVCLGPRRRAHPSQPAHTAPAGGRFSDVTAAAGLLPASALPQKSARTSPNCLFDQFDLGRRGWNRGAFCAPELMTGGAAAGDLDGDGLVDLYVTRLDGADSLFLNAGNGTFADATVASRVGALTERARSNGVALLDIDNDGDLDVFISTLGDTRMRLLVNNGAGRFAEEAVERGVALERDAARPAGEGGLTSSFSVAVGDYDGDGWLDLYTTEWFPRLHVPQELFSDKGIHELSTCRLLRNLGARGPRWAGVFEDATWAAGIRPRAGGATMPGEDMTSGRWFSERHQQSLLRQPALRASALTPAEIAARVAAANAEARALFAREAARGEAMERMFGRMRSEDGGAHSVGGAHLPAHYFEGASTRTEP